MFGILTKKKCKQKKEEFFNNSKYIYWLCSMNFHVLWSIIVDIQVHVHICIIILLEKTHADNMHIKIKLTFEKN